MITNIIFITLLTASVLSGLIPVIYGISRYKAFNIQLKALFIYICGALVTETSMFLLTVGSLPVVHLQFIFTVFEFLIIIYIYWNEFNTRTHKIIIITGIALFAIGTAVSFYMCSGLSSVNDCLSVIEASIIILLSVIFFFKVMTELQIPKLTNYPFFWVNSAFLVYFGTAFFLYLFNNAAKDFETTLIYFLSGIHHIVNITFNILLAIGICKVKKL